MFKFLVFFLCVSSICIANEPVVIFLNGTSSAGKSSVALEIQRQADQLFLHLGHDHFTVMLPPSYGRFGENAAKGYEFIRMDDEQGPKISVKVGPVGRKFSYAYRQAIKSLYESGFNLIIDEVLFLQEDYKDYLELFQGAKMLFVAVKPPLEVAIARENARGNRVLGLARGLYEDVYEGKHDDLLIDSSTSSPEQSARMILDHLKSHPLTFNRQI